MNDRVYEISCRKADKSGKKISYIFLDTQSIVKYLLIIWGKRSYFVTIM